MPLTITASRGSLLRAGRALALPVLPGATRVQVGAGAEVLATLGVEARGALSRDKATGEAGQVSVLTVGRRGVDVVLLVGVGDGSSAALRKAAAAAVRRAKPSASLATTLSVGRDEDGIRAIAEGLGLGSYTFGRKSAPSDDLPDRATLVVDDLRAVEPALERARATIAAVHLARDLARTPSKEKSPEWMVEQAREIARTAGLDIEVWDERALARDAFGGILAVGRGSARPPRLVRLSYAPPGATRHVVLVGKGITFDSGGLSLKPPDGMTMMKTDMSGSAAVLAAMSALRALDVPVRVTALTPFAENMPGGDATRPGDVLTHYGSRTTEVLNTDAEGRLVLADALAYAVARLSPDVVVDLATLTGAATLGLGKRHGALYATTDELAAELVAAGAAAGEQLWRLPLVEDYRDALESPVADARNIADPGKRYGGGSIVAALFLQPFVAGVPWAHLDIAGPARADADEAEVTKGASGFGTRALLRWLETAG